MEHIVKNDQLLTVVVREGFHYPWLLSAVYIYPKAVFHEHLWQYISQLSSCFLLPWCLVDDFNQVLQNDEKISGEGINFRCARQLWNMVDLCNFMELDFHDLSNKLDLTQPQVQMAFLQYFFKNSVM